MKIVLSGVETNNKGAELMLYAILQEVERKWPDAEVYISRSRVLPGLDSVKTKVQMHCLPYEGVIAKSHINSILYRLNLPTIEGMNFVQGDYFLDGSGFLFSDQCKLWGIPPKWWENVLKHHYKKGAKIVFLPQAFGPLEMEMTKKAIRVLDKYATVIMAREQVSYDYLKKSGLVDMKKVRIFTDFTSLVDGVFPKGYEHLRGGICIIPNKKMILKGGISYEDYIKLLTAIAEEGKKSGHPVYLLNHEGPKDAELCLRCKETIGGDIEAVTDINGLEVKGLIASAYIVITSRFHGLASSLNSGVPSLATSWSHKYEELFKDYGLSNDYVLPLNDMESAILKVKNLIEGNTNAGIRAILEKKVPEIKDQTRDMWNVVWGV